MKVVMIVMNDMAFDQRVHREAAALGNVGHDVTVVCLHGHGLSDTECRGVYRIMRVAWPTTVTWNRPVQKVRQSARRTSVLCNAAVALEPDVIHAHDTDTLPAAARAAKMTSARLVYDAHELFPDQFVGSGMGAVGVARPWWRLVERRLIPKADAVVTVSPGLAGVLRQRYGVEATVIRNLPPLLPRIESRRLREELGVRDDTPLVLYQGLLLPERGLVELVKSMAGVERAVLVIQGTGPEESSMRRVAKDLGLHDRVRFMGWVAPEDAHEYACGADIGVVIYEAATLNNQLAGPNKLYAYLMAGLPVAARGFPGPREVVVGEDVGDVFDEATPASIAATLNRMLLDTVRLASMAERARHVAESKYNWERESQVLVELYAGLSGTGG